MKSIKLKLFASFCSIFILAMLIISTLSILISRTALEAATRDGLTSTTEQMSLLISSKLSEQLTFMKSNAIRRIVYDDTPWDEKVNSLQDVAQLSDYDYLAFAGPDGQATLFDTAKTRLDIKDQPYFQTALTGTATYSPILIDPISGNPCIFVAAPTIKSGEIIGVFFGKCDTDLLQKLVRDFKLGDTGYTYLIDHKATIIAHPNTQMVADQFNLITYSDEHADTLSSFKQTLENNILTDQTGATTYSFDGRHMLATYTTVVGSDWILLTAINYTEVYAPVTEFIIILIVLLVVISLMVLATTYLLGLSITNPISYLTTLLGRFALYNFSPLDQQQLSHLETLSRRKDEIGHIAKSLTHLHQSLATLLLKARDISNQLAASSQELSSISEQSALTADSIAQNIQTISTLSTSQSELAGEGTDQTHHIGSLIEDSTRHFQTILDSLVQVDQQNVAGEAGLKDLLARTTSRDTSDAQVSDLVMRTVSSTTKITGASHMLERIAEQTNLLAINSAIEAAHAGDSGKGFAVVASEIRKLAGDSGTFTKEINAILDTLRLESQEALDKLTSSKTIATLQNASVLEAQTQFHTISLAITDAKEMIHITHQAIQAIEGYKDQVVSTITNLSQLSQKNADHTQEIAAASQQQSASIEEIATASQALASLAEELDAVVAQFTL